MNRIAEEVETDATYRSIIQAQRTEPEATGADAIADAARQIAETLDLAAIACWTFSGSTGAARRARAAALADRGDLAQRGGGAQIVGRLGRALRRCRGRARPRRHGGPRLPARLPRRVRKGRSAHHHRGGRAARHAGRDQHGADRVRGIGRGGGLALLVIPAEAPTARKPNHETRSELVNDGSRVSPYRPDAVNALSSPG